MEPPITKWTPEECTVTSTGNKIYKKSSLYGMQNIIIAGKSILSKDCLLRGDLSTMRMGKFVFVGERAVVRAGHRGFSKGVTMLPVHVGDNVIIEEDVITAAAQIGSYSRIGKGAVIGRSVIIKECCRVEPGAVVPPDSVFPPFSIIAGNPARVVGSMPDCTQDLAAQAAKELYESYVIQR